MAIVLACPGALAQRMWWMDTLGGTLSSSLLDGTDVRTEHTGIFPVPRYFTFNPAGTDNRIFLSMSGTTGVFEVCPGAPPFVPTFRAGSRAFAGIDFDPGRNQIIGVSALRIFSMPATGGGGDSELDILWVAGSLLDCWIEQSTGRAFVGHSGGAIIIVQDWGHGPKTQLSPTGAFGGRITWSVVADSAVAAMFYSDSIDSIWTSNFARSSETIVYTAPAGGVGALRIDPSSQRLYFSTYAGTIERVDYMGMNHEVLVTGVVADRLEIDFAGIPDTCLISCACGDCDENLGPSPDILDSLTAAQLAAGLSVPTMGQTVCCDVDSSGVISVIDALGIAQTAAGLSVMLTCP